MTTKDQSTPSDELKISQLYQEGATEQPLSLIDQQILQQAKAALPESKECIDPVQHIRPKTWRKWQWSGSIAASALLVSWLFIFNQPYFQRVDLVADEYYIESKIVVKKQREEAARTQPLQNNPQLQISAGPEQTLTDIEDSSLSKLLMSEQRSSFTKDEKDIAETDTLSADFELSAPAPQNMASEKGAETASALAKHKNKSSPDYQHLDTLLQKLLFYRQKLDVNQSSLNAAKPLVSDQSGEHSESKNNVSAQKIQFELFTLLLEYKQGDPKLLVPQKYLNVLSQEQLNELAMMTNEELDG